MQRIAFTMKLHAGFETEYIRRHNAIWPELQALLKEKGVEDYSIFLDEAANILFGYLRIPDASALDTLPHTEIMQRWWAYMKDIMDTNEDNSPVSISLNEVFYLP